MLKTQVKKAVKRVLPKVVINNLQGLNNALRTYYPQYLLGNDDHVAKIQEVYIEVTMRCVCRCQMCPLFGTQADAGKQLMEQARRETELTLDEFKTLFADLARLGSPFINFTGGEAFLRKDMLEIIASARENGLRCSFTTSGGLFTEAIAKRVVELGVNSITFSVDGPKEIHEEIRKVHNFDKIMNAVDMVNAEKARQGKTMPSMNFLCTISAMNQHHLAPMVEIAKKKNVPMNFDPIIFVTPEAWETTLKAFNHSFMKIENFVMPPKTIGVDTGALETELTKVKAEAKRLKQDIYISVAGAKAREKFWKDQDYYVVNKCLAPWFGARIDAYGNVYQCSISTGLGNLREESFVQIWNGPKYQEFRRKVRDEGPWPFCNKCCVMYSGNAYWNFLPRRIPFSRFFKGKSKPIVEFEPIQQTKFSGVKLPILIAEHPAGHEHQEEHACASH